MLRLIAQSCPNSCDPMTVARQAPLSIGILQARILEWVAMPSSRGSSQPRGWTQVSHIAGRFFTVWISREAQQSIGPEKQTSLPLSVRTCSQPWSWDLRGYLQRLPTLGDGCFKAGWLQYLPSSSALCFQDIDRRPLSVAAVVSFLSSTFFLF